MQLRQMDKVLFNIERGVVGIGMIIATIVVFVNVVARYFFSYSLSWAEEIARYVMVWVAMFGASLCVRKGLHVNVDIVKFALPTIVWRILLPAIYLVSAAFMAYILYIGVKITFLVKASGQVSPSMGFFPMYLLYICVPVGSFLTGIQFFRMFRKAIAGGEEVKKVEGR